jgi:hypothetical protein
MKFSIASSFANKETVRALASRLIKEGLCDNVRRFSTHGEEWYK